MTSPIYDPFDDPDSEVPANRFLLMIMLEAIKPGMERIHFERFPDTNGGDGRFVVSYERDGEYIEKATPPFEMWHEVIARLKVIACVVDNDPEKSEDGHFSLRLSKSRAADYQLTTHPDPTFDNKVTLVHKGTRETPIHEAPERSIQEIEEEMRRQMESIPEGATVLEAPVLIAISSNDEMWNKMEQDKIRAYLEKQAPGARVIINKDPKKKNS